MAGTRGLGVLTCAVRAGTLDLAACFGGQPSRPGGEYLPCSPLALAHPPGPEEVFGGVDEPAEWHRRLVQDIWGTGLEQLVHEAFGPHDPAGR